MANTSLGIKEGVWDVFFRKIFSLTNGNGCADFILFEGEIYQVRIGCDKLTTIKSMLSWVMMAVTFWYVFTSLTSLLRKGGD